MKKASLLFILLVGLVFAQGGVRISEPLDGTITTDASQDINYIFGSPETIDPSSINLYINGDHYTTADPEVIWNPANLTFLATGWMDGEVVVCSLDVVTTWGGDTVLGTPLVTSFTVDLSDPFLLGYQPGNIWERPDFPVIHDVEEPVKIWLCDEFGTINRFTIDVAIGPYMVIDSIVTDAFLGTADTFWSDASSVMDVMSFGMSWEEDVMYIDGSDDFAFFLGEATIDTFYYGTDSIMYVAYADDSTWFGAEGSIDTFLVGTEDEYYVYHGADGDYMFGPAYPWIEVTELWDGTFRWVDTSDDTFYCDVITFDPAEAEVRWPCNDTVRVHVYGTEDYPDYGAPNYMSYYDDYNIFWFAVDAQGPAYTALYPIASPAHPTGLTYSACADIPIRMHFEDNYGLDLTTLTVSIRGAVLDIYDSHITIDTLGWVLWDGDTVVTEAQLTYMPSPQFYNGETVHIELLTLEDIHGNSFRVIDGPRAWDVFIDRSGPYVDATYPMSGITTDDQEQIVSFDAYDRLGMIDPASIHVVFHTTSGDHYEYTGISDVLIPEITWDGGTYTFDPEAAGITWDQGDTVYCTVFEMTDLIDFCPANEMTHDPVSWYFYVSNGPNPEILAPKDHEYSSCQQQPVTFTFIDPDGVDPSTVVFEYEGEMFTTASEETTFVEHYVGSVLVAVDTFTAAPLIESGGTFTFIPPDRFVAENAEEIECAIHAAEDMLGNPMWGGPVYWSFITDLTAPYVVDYFPEPGSYAGGPSPIITVEFGDDVSGMIDILNTAIELNGIYFGFDSYELIPAWDPETNTLIVDPSLEGLSYTHGQEVEVCITHLYDNPENRCDIFSNPSPDVPMCWSFMVDNNPPVATVVEPLMDDMTACANQQIVIHITDDIGVDPTEAIMIVEDLMYNFDDPEITWDAVDNNLIFTPSRPWRDGQVVDFRLYQIADIAGNFVMGSSSMTIGSFTVDLTVPEVVATDPEEDIIVDMAIDYITVTLDDASGLNWETVMMEVDVDGDVYAFDWEDDVFMTGGSSIMLDLEAAGIDFAPGGASVNVHFEIDDNPEWACPDANRLVHTYSFDITPGWYVDILINDTYIITFGAAYGASDMLDGFDVYAAPAGPDFTPASFLTDGERLDTDVKNIETESPVWQIWSGSEPIVLEWDPADIPEYGSFVINGIVDMRDTEEGVFTAEPGEAVWINHDVDIMEMHSGWNLVSTPIHPMDPAPEAVFPMAYQIWEYNPIFGRYEEPTTIEVGKAYFVLYIPGAGEPDPWLYTIPGTPAYEYMIEDYVEGWNTIGGVYDFGGVDFTEPADVPDGSFTSPVYGYDNAAGTYYDSDVLVAGHGYWSYVGLPVGWPGYASLEVTSWEPRMGLTPVSSIIWDASINVNGQQLTFGEATGNVSSLDRRVPPAMPGQSGIEASFAGFSADYRENDLEWTLDVATSGSMRYDFTGLNVEITLDGNVLSGRGNVEVAGGSHVLKATPKVAPETYALHQNAPNPFNGATEITFETPEDAEVLLTIHDELGRTVRTLISNTLSAGTHSVTWDAKDQEGNDLPSGVYHYSIKAGTFQAMDKMLYVK